MLRQSRFEISSDRVSGGVRLLLRKIRLIAFPISRIPTTSTGGDSNETRSIRRASCYDGTPQREQIPAIIDCIPLR